MSFPPEIKDAVIRVPKLSESNVFFVRWPIGWVGAGHGCFLLCDRFIDAVVMLDRGLGISFPGTLDTRVDWLSLRDARGESSTAFGILR